MKCPICESLLYHWEMDSEDWKRIRRKLERYKAMRKEIKKRPKVNP